MQNMHINPYDEILPNLYVGGVKALDNRSFDMIVNLIKQTPLSDKTIPSCKSFIRIPINDSPDDSDLLLLLINETQVLEHIHKSLSSGETVLVHCFAGMSRSATIVACYLIKYTNMSLLNAIEFIKTKRPIVFMGGIHFSSVLTAISNKHNYTILYKN